MSNLQVLSGFWKIPGFSNEYNGELYLDSDSRMIKLNLLSPYDQANCPDLKNISHIPYICGKLMTGASIVLSKCGVGTNYQHYMDYIRQTIWAEYAFWGLTANDENDLLFKGVRVEFEDIVGWCDLCKFSSDFDNETQGIIFKWDHKDPITYTVKDNL